MALEKYQAKEKPTSTKFNLMVEQVNENTSNIDKLKKITANDIPTDSTDSEGNFLSIQEQLDELKSFDTITYKGSVATYADLPDLTTVENGWMYQVNDTHKHYVAVIDAKVPTPVREWHYYSTFDNLAEGYFDKDKEYPADTIGAFLVQLSSKSDRFQETLGNYTERDNIELTALETGVVISKDGVKTAKEGWAIAEFTAVKGNEYLLKPGTMSGDVCLFAEKITKQETRNIDYTYTYNEDGNIATAKATYGGSTHTYTYSYTYDEEGKVASETITDDQTGAIVQALPYQYKTSVGTYQPMTILNESAELPEDGYCRLVSHFQNDTSLTVVVSFNTADADLTMKVVRDGFTASICTQLSNLAKRISNTSDHAANIDETLAGVEENQDSMIGGIAKVPDYPALPLLCGQPPILFGAGTPQESVVPVNWNQYDPETDTGYQWNGEPSAIGQQYINTNASSGGRYIAVQDSNYGLTWKNF